MKEHTTLKTNDQVIVCVNKQTHIAVVLEKEVLETGDLVNVRLIEDQKKELFLLMKEENGMLTVLKALSAEQSPS
ncbi:TPA: hypothetical protein DF272_04120 [Candidatus Falkowbacteria bacterium]|nr:hypothetical protein [Candidatus Falkowbacteria bacterium]